VTARRGEAGAATLLAVSLAGVLLLVGAALAVVGAMVAAHRQAQAAADLAALAGATAAARGDGPCQSARVVARLNDATVVACAVDGSDVTVQVRVPGPHWLGQAADLEARARAGPGRASTDPPEPLGKGLDEE
jgi:secretion/DNA translocation related TadE-like protein